MDMLLLILGAISMLLGIAGALLPVLPGPPLSYAGLLLLHFSDYGSFSTRFLVIYGLVTLVVFVIDLAMPAGAAKAFGASRYGTWGAGIGVVAGLFFLPPLGIIIFPFAGALAGELLQGKAMKTALKGAWGSFLGFIVGVVIKIALCLVMAYYFVRELIDYF